MAWTCDCHRPGKETHALVVESFELRGVDRRERSGETMGGGLPHVLPLPEVAETNYASRVRIPVLNGAYDSVFPLETNQKPMFELLGSEEKEHVVFESGHVLVGHRNQSIQRLLDWLDSHLGPVS